MLCLSPRSSEFKKAILQEMKGYSGTDNPTLTKTGFITMFTKHGLATSLASRLFELADVNGDGDAYDFQQTPSTCIELCDSSSFHSYCN